MTHELADWARAMLNYNSEEYDPEMVINKLLRQDETVSNLKHDLAQRTAEYEAKVDEVIALKKEIAVMGEVSAWVCGRCGLGAADHSLPGHPSYGCVYDPVLVIPNSALLKEIANLRYQVQNQTLRADDAVAAIEVWKRDFVGQRKRIGALEEALREEEWGDHNENGESICPECGSWKSSGRHAKDCMVAAALGREGSGDGTLTAHRNQPDDFEQFTSGLPNKPAGSNMDQTIGRRKP